MNRLISGIWMGSRCGFDRDHSWQGTFRFRTSKYL